MAIVYVWNGATGAADGTSWTDAYTTLGAAWSAWSSGDVVYMHSGHSESSATTINYASGSMTNADPFMCYSVDKDNSDAYTPASAAQVTVTGTNADLDIDDASWFYGVYFKIDDGDVIGTSASVGSVSFVDSTIRIGDSETANRVISSFSGVLFESCTFTSQLSTNALYFSNVDNAWFVNCTFTGKFSLGSGIGIFGSETDGPSIFQGCDFTGVTSATTVVGSATTGAKAFNCKYPSGMTFADNIATPDVGYMVNAAFACTLDGASTAKNYDVEMSNSYGRVVHDTSIYRDSGWSDEEGTTQLSHKVTPDSSLSYPVQYIFGPDLVAYADSTGSKTFTVYCVHDFTTAPTKDEAWIEVAYLGTSNSTLHSFAGGRSVLSSATWTVGTEAWTGASGKTKMELSATATINKTGVYAVRVYLGKYEAAKALWYCPKVEVT